MNNNEEKCILDYGEFGSMCVKSLDGTTGTLQVIALPVDGGGGPTQKH